MTPHQIIYIWPDKTWCRQLNLEDYGWKSDDYRIQIAAKDMTDEEIEKQISFQEKWFKHEIVRIN